MIPLERKSENF